MSPVDMEVPGDDLDYESDLEPIIRSRTELYAATDEVHDEAKFEATRFDHARTGFDLEGRHATAPCESCHKKESGVFPAGTALLW